MPKAPLRSAFPFATSRLLGRFRRSPVLAAMLAAWMAGSCRLDGSGKSRCIIDADCLHGRVCVQGMCAAAQPGPDASAVVLCDASSGVASCPDAPTGGRMTCFQNSALSGQDFCAPACDPTQAAPDSEHFACVDSGALLRRCHPSSSAEPSADCPAGLNCYRTNLISDEGLCLRMPVCAKDSDCPSATHKTCAATILGSLSLGSALFQLDHLNCIHQSCVGVKSDCPPAEGCLATQYAMLADLCVPLCDSHLQCPPNYSCAPSAANLCLPAVPGNRCTGDHCILGGCADTGAGFSVCTIPCASDADCAVLDTSVDAYVCVDGGGTRHCVTPRAFNGANCQTNAQCNAGRNEFCAHWDRYGPVMGYGDCRIPCNAPDGTCDSQGGLPFGCLGDAGGCHPAVLGVPCGLQAQCISPLSCLDVPAEPDTGATSPRFCTRPCGVDACGDAAADPECGLPSVGGYCGNGFCRLPRVAGQPCDCDVQCGSHRCDGVTHTCQAAPSNPSGL